MIPLFCALTQTNNNKCFLSNNNATINWVKWEAEVCDFVSLGDRGEQELSPEHNPVSQGWEQSVCVGIHGQDMPTVGVFF